MVPTAMLGQSGPGDVGQVRVPDPLCPAGALFPLGRPFGLLPASDGVSG
jgi:hypothetical protein